MSEQQDDVRITLRLPKELHEWLARLAAGDRRRPPASLNRTIVFVLEAGKRALESESDLGQWVPESLELVEA